MNKSILTAVIIDDEPESVQLLESLILSNGNARVAGTTSNPAEALDLIKSLDPDIVFLDVKMPGKTGFEVLDDLIKNDSCNPYVVFTTAFDEYAVRAFEYAAFDYLLKPVEPDRLAFTLMRCKETESSRIVQKSEVLHDFQRKLAYRNIAGIIIIDPSEVAYVEADGNYSVFKLKDGKTETVSVQLGKIEDDLPQGKFFRISRTYLINLSFLKKINTRKRECILQCGSLEFTCEISRDKIKTMLDHLRS